MGQRHVCTFRHAQRAAYRTAISAAQILVKIILTYLYCTVSEAHACGERIAQESYPKGRGPGLELKLRRSQV